MSKLAVVSDKEFVKISRILSEGITVIIPRSLAKKYPIGQLEEAASVYECGGEADRWVELVGDKSHFFFSELNKLSKAEKGS